MTIAGSYPAQQGVDAHGVLLLIANRRGANGNLVTSINGVTPAWLPIANVVDVSSPRMTKTFHDVTPSIPGAWKQAVPGFKDPGTVTLTLLFNPTFGSHGVLLDSYTSDALETFILLIPNENGAHPRWKFTGYVSSLSTSHSAGGIILGRVGLRLTGPVTHEFMNMGTLWPDVSESGSGTPTINLNNI